MSLNFLFSWHVLLFYCALQYLYDAKYWGGFMLTQQNSALKMTLMLQQYIASD